MTYLLPLFYCFFYSDSICAKSLKATADQLGREMIIVGLALAIFGFALGGTMKAIGMQDAGKKVTGAALGTIVIVSATSLIQFAQSLA